MIASHSDSWFFVYDEPTGLWVWKRVSASGEEVAQSAFSFASFTVCVADAERSGFDPNAEAVRRVRASDLALRPHMPQLERRRRPRGINGESAP